MKLNNNIEALLFLSGEPLRISRLAKILGKNEKEIEEAAKELEEQLKERGIRLLKKNNELMLGSAKEASPYCESLVKEEFDRSIGRAGLETLAIILYKGSASRPEIDYIRGVNSTFTLRNLMIRGLIKRGLNPKDKRVYIYSPSMQILQYLGITKKEELPDFENFVKQMQNAEQSD